MNQASTWDDLSPQLRKVAERARREPDGRFHSLAHPLHVGALGLAVGRLRGEVLPKRMQRYGLALHPDKTRLLDFRRPPQERQEGKGPSAFDFLGFTLHRRRTLRGYWRLGCQTRRARLHRAMNAVYVWCRNHRHWPLVDHAGLRSRLQGHMNYFGVNGNLRSVANLYYHAVLSWKKWLSRRSRRAWLTWERMKLLLQRYPLPPPRIVVPIWGRDP